MGFHIIIVLSTPPLANKPSGNTVKDLTGYVCSVKIFIASPLFGLHILIVSSKLPLANKPTGNTAKDLTISVRPVKILIVSPLLGWIPYPYCIIITTTYQ